MIVDFASTANRQESKKRFTFTTHIQPRGHTCLTPYFWCLRIHLPVMNKITTLTCALLLGASPTLLATQEPEAVLEEVAVQETTTFRGKVVPLDADQVVLEMASWNSLRFHEVAAHGSVVEEGQVIARFDTRDLEKRILETQLRLESTWTRNDIAQARAELSEEGAVQRLEAAELALVDARDAFKNWTEFELDNQRSSAKMSALRTQHGIDDAEDELAQLEAMYTEDELTDATEEIVLKRSQRNLARQKVSAELAAAVREFTARVRWAKTTRDYRLGVHRAEIALDRSRRSLEIERIEHRMQALERENSVQKLSTELEDLQADLGRCVVKAPRSGMLLHGGARQYHPGANAPRFEQYSDGYVRRALFTIANPGSFGVVFHFGEDELSQLDLEQAATASVVAKPDVSVSGSVSVAPTNYAAYNNMPSNRLIGVVQLASQIKGLMPGMGVDVQVVKK